MQSTVQRPPYQQVCKYSEYLLTLIHCNWFVGIFGVFKVWWIILICFSLYVSLLRGIICKFFLHCHRILFSVITNLLFLIHFQVNSRTLCCHFALYQHYFLTIGRLSVTEARTKLVRRRIARWRITCIAQPYK